MRTSRTNSANTSFLSTPSARRATTSAVRCSLMNWISIHALREEGDSALWTSARARYDFYPRPPRGGRLECIGPRHGAKKISIHALREEGDGHRQGSGAGAGHFYPRPPRGGRHFLTEDEDVINGFLSTPSARRATLQRGFDNQSVIFLSTPSARRATTALTAVLVSAVLISIHALREEGDYTSPCP